MLVIEYGINENEEEFNPGDKEYNYKITYIEFFNNQNEAKKKLKTLSDNAFISKNDRDIFLYSYFPNHCKYYSLEDGILMLDSSVSFTNHIRSLIDKRLKASETYILPDSDMTNKKRIEWKSYRDELRKIKDNLNDDTIYSVVLPNEPDNEVLTSSELDTEINKKIKEITIYEHNLRNDHYVTFNSEVLGCEAYCDYETRENVRYLIDSHESGKISYKCNSTDVQELTLNKLKKFYTEMMDYLIGLKQKKWEIKENIIPQILGDTKLTDQEKIQRIKEIKI